MLAINETADQYSILKFLCQTTRKYGGLENDRRTYFINLNVTALQVSTDSRLHRVELRSW